MTERKRSYIKKNKTRKIHKRSGNRKYGLNIKSYGKLSNDILFKIASIVSGGQKKLLMLLNYTSKLVDNTLNDIKPPPSNTYNLSFIDKIKSSVLNNYRSSINSFVDNLKPAQIILLSKGKYNYEAFKKIMFGIEPKPVDESEIKGMKERLELIILKSIFGTILLNKIKRFVKSLDSKQFIILLKKGFNLEKSLLRSFVNTKYVSKLKDEDIININKEIV